MLNKLTSRGILFICLHKGRSCTYLDVKKDIEFLKIPFQYSTIPVVHSTVYTLPLISIVGLLMQVIYGLIEI